MIGGEKTRRTMPSDNDGYFFPGREGRYHCSQFRLGQQISPLDMEQARVIVEGGTLLWDAQAFVVF